MSVIGGKCKVPIQSPLQHRFRLMTDISSIGRLASLDQIDCRAVNAVVGVFAPETVPGQSQDQVPADGQVELRMNINVIRRAD